MIIGELVNSCVGGDGSVRVWAKGVSQYMPTSRSQTAMDGAISPVPVSASSRRCTRSTVRRGDTGAGQHVVEEVPDVAEGIPGAANADRMASATPDQMDLLGTGRSIDSRNSFFATPGWCSYQASRLAIVLLCLVLKYTLSVGRSGMGFSA